MAYVHDLAPGFLFFFFFNDTATTEIYTLSLHDALPISGHVEAGGLDRRHALSEPHAVRGFYFPALRDRKSTRLNSSHSQISYAVFCLKKKKDTEVASRVQVQRRYVHPLVVEPPRAACRR